MSNTWRSWSLKHDDRIWIYLATWTKLLLRSLGTNNPQKTVDTVEKQHTRFAIYTVKPQYEQVSLNFCRGWWGLKNHHSFGIDVHYMSWCHNKHKSAIPCLALTPPPAKQNYIVPETSLFGTYLCSSSSKFIRGSGLPLNVCLECQTLRQSPFDEHKPNQ